MRFTFLEVFSWTPDHVLTMFLDLLQSCHCRIPFPPLAYQHHRHFILKQILHFLETYSFMSEDKFFLWSQTSFQLGCVRGKWDPCISENALFCPCAWLTWYIYEDSKPRFPQNFKDFVPLSSEIQNVCQVWWQLESLSFLGNLIWTLIALKGSSLYLQRFEILPRYVSLFIFLILLRTWFAHAIWRPCVFLWV